MTKNSGDTRLTIDAALKFASNRFQAAGLELSQLDARILLQSVMGMEHSQLISANDQQLSDDHIAKFNEFIERRLNRQPVHRIIGEKEIWGLKFKTSNAVLDPRADTECLVETVLSNLDRRGRKNAALRIVDIGTGSGAIALALLSELPNAKVVATDISADALKVAGYNAKRLGFASRVMFQQGSYFEPLSGLFDIIISNPPYITTSDIAMLEPEVREYDPKIALDGGVDGLDAYRSLLGEAASWLNKNGTVFFEIGFDQATRITTLATEFGWRSIKISKDFGKNDRVFEASR